ncbi:type 2 DNA topoisomerase 6 subunit B-like [Cornus florida]|uniref:type 2 DNA topoisomerase 6 subunit B-like n=1 Tax=Cornus florida TaxID=4283 RepID=UPI00289D0F0C|nr:type 2 DNA topoisomerase 6 subunit B-like [Cornus florida]
MNISSVQKLCQHFICSAIQRCRKSDDLCRISVMLKSNSSWDTSLVRISISDTGVGSFLEEFQDLKCTGDPASTEKWDGVISVTTTTICDNEIYHYRLDLKEIVSARRITKLPSNSKNGAKFSGTEVSLSAMESIDDLLAEITNFFRKILILKIPKVAVELVVDCGDIPGSQYENLILANECIHLPSPASSIDCLKSGLEDYVLKHENILNNICHSCFSSREHLKVGSGVTCSPENHRRNGQVMEAVIIISELSDPTTSSCFRARDAKTEVFYFKDFTLCSISQSSLDALTSIDWKSFGLTLRSIADQDGCALLEWGNLPPHAHIDIALHCYHKQVMIPAATHKTQRDRSFTKKAVKLALNDLKEKNKGVLLSSHALKICSYAPDLARTVAGLILSSNDLDFQGECFSMLGLQFQEIEGKVVENCIKERIISVIEMNDRKPRKGREDAPVLFDDDCFQEPDLLDEEYEEGEDAFSSLDL